MGEQTWTSLGADERFWRRVDKSGGPDACWPWMGPRERRCGYGQFNVYRPGIKRHVLAHRYAYESAVGDIPEGLQVLHECDNGPCVNPSHLHLGTQSQNMLEMHERGRHRWWEALTECKNGHEFTPENVRTDEYGRRHCRPCHRGRVADWYDREHGTVPCQAVTRDGNPCSFRGRYESASGARLCGKHFSASEVAA